MSLSHDGIYRRTDIWREGKWLDLWSVVHLLSGVSLGFGTILFRFGAPASIVINFLILVSYEMWEAMVKIEETPQNRIMDVVVGMASFLLTYLYVLPGIKGSLYIFSFAIVLVMNIMLAVFGWRASHKAAALEKRLREEIEAQKQKFRERRARRLARLQKRRSSAYNSRDKAGGVA